MSGHGLGHALWRRRAEAHRGRSVNSGRVQSCLRGLASGSPPGVGTVGSPATALAAAVLTSAECPGKLACASVRRYASRIDRIQSAWRQRIGSVAPACALRNPAGAESGVVAYCASTALSAAYGSDIIHTQGLQHGIRLCEGERRASGKPRHGLRPGPAGRGLRFCSVPWPAGSGCERRQPGGGFMALGTSPITMARWRVASTAGSATGTAASSACV